MRYLKASICTKTRFSLAFDVMLRDPALAQGNYIVRVVYTFSANLEASSTRDISEDLVKIENADKTYEIIYSINGLESSKKLVIIRNICLDACKGLNIKCENCLSPLESTLVRVNGTLNKHTFINFYYKVYQIAMQGEGSIENAVFSEQPPHFDLARMAGDYLVSKQNANTGGWPINVTRSFDKKSNLSVKPGWYSAMVNRSSFKKNKEGVFHILLNLKTIIKNVYEIV